MSTFLLWNVDLRHNTADLREVCTLLGAILQRDRPDVVVLVECQVPAERLLHALGDVGGSYGVVSSHERFRVLVRFDPRFLTRIDVVPTSDRIDVWRLELPRQSELIVAVVHGLDRRNNSAGKRELFLQQVAARLAQAEALAGHERSVLLGDFNANPFEPAMSASTGLHAVGSRRVAVERERDVMGSTSKFFYNPMWGMLGDARGVDRSIETPGGTYYYTSAEPHELYWHMLDQVVVRPDVVPMFDHNALEIITQVGEHSFVTGTGLPNRRTASDHLPVLFNIDHQLKAAVAP